MPDVLAGLVSGGGYGLFHGVRDSAGERQRIRVNKVLNATAKNGPGLDGGSAATPDYLFETDVDPSFRRSWGERLTFHVGGAYLLGACCLRLARLRAPTRRTLFLIHAHTRQRK